MDTPIKELLFKIADDLLIIGHRNSEWTGLGPVLEEDISFSSIAQDQIGQSRAVYSILHELGEPDPDSLGFNREAKEFRCCNLVEYPIGGYDFSLIRNFLFSYSSQLRFEMLSGSSFEPIAKLARKVKGEIKYHVMHDNTWILQLGNGSEESISRLQTSLNENFNRALGIFEPGDYESELSEMKVFEGENVLKKKWLVGVKEVLSKTVLKLPEESAGNPAFGGRRGYHTEYLEPLLNEMSEVFKLDPAAEW
jgi:ring-1,2-phenylacetyl-CoA epoxidase subunit PaaC